MKLRTDYPRNRRFPVRLVLSYNYSNPRPKLTKRQMDYPRNSNQKPKRMKDRMWIEGNWNNRPPARLDLAGYCANPRPTAMTVNSDFPGDGEFLPQWALPTRFYRRKKTMELINWTGKMPQWHALHLSKTCAVVFY